jgi:hypothetical protein
MLTAEDKAERSRQRMLEKAKEFQTGTYINRFVAPVFQQVIRAEAAAMPQGLTVVIVSGEVGQSFRRVGECACVTCGTVRVWNSGILGMHTGHFLGSRRNSILFEEDNCAPQCHACNYYPTNVPEAYLLWMRTVRPEAIERLEKLKTTSRTFTRDELVDMRISYAARLRAAETRMVNGA